MRIPISKPYFDAQDKQNLIKPLESGWVVQGPFVKEFENLFASFARVPFAVACSNCTTALHLGLRALGIGAGAHVVVPSFTYIASANAVEYTGATPVFCDIDLRTFNLDTDSLQNILESQKIDAIMPVHLFGLCANMPRILELARHYDVRIIEDAACGFDAKIGEQHSGSFGDCGCFSFHPRKAISTGEGGMLITKSAALADLARSMRDHGASTSDLERHKMGGSLLPNFDILGYNYRLTDLQGALGVSQMQKATFIMERRRAIASAYFAALADHPLLLAPMIPEGYTHGFQSFVCLFGGAQALEARTLAQIDSLNAQRNAFMQKLEQKGIATRQGTHAVHTLGFYRDKYGLKSEDYLKSYAADRLSISLPLYASMSESELDYVLTNLRAL